VRQAAAIPGFDKDSARFLADRPRLGVFAQIRQSTALQIPRSSEEQARALAIRLGCGLLGGIPPQFTVANGGGSLRDGQIDAGIILVLRT
jgi:hypothetical protein